ncbi:MAG: RNA polymerase sigma factor [Myxococcales bacterium]|nr:RNA polymerase sigma factor [Myxococcales bacterium]
MEAVEARELTFPPPPASGIQSVALRERPTPGSSSLMELYRSHVKYVWKAARRLGLTPTEADDAVQETFLTAHRRAASYDARGFERSWLFSILYNVVLHHRRSHQRRTARTEDGFDLDVLPSPSSVAPDQRAETSEGARILEEILAGLEPERRAVLVLAEFEERPVSEIAEILGINVSTATSRLRLAREQVEAAMARRRARDGWRYK